MELINRFCGYDGESLARLSEKDRRYLGISSALSLIGVGLSSLSAFYLIHSCTGSFISSAVGTVLVLFILHALLVVLISGAGLPVFQKKGSDSSDNARWSRLAIFLLISLVFTQPIIVFLIDLTPWTNRVDAKLRQQSVITHQRMRDSLASLVSTREREIALMTELHDRLLANKYEDIEFIDQIIPDVARSGRKALVIGNQTYSFRPLENPKKDATDIASVLTKMGFTVTLLIDVDQIKMQRGIDEYVSSLRPKDVSVFYFSGHGFSDGNGNFLMPIGMSREDPIDAVGLSINLEKISKRHPLVSVAIIDACRDFPFGTMRRGGLKEVAISPNTYLAMAASPGQRAADGPTGSNGLFSGAVIKNLARHVDIDRVFRSVREEVYRKSGDTQLPATFSTLREDFVLVAPNRKKSQESRAVPELSMRILSETKFRGLSVNLDQVVEPYSKYCSIVGNPDEDQFVRDQLIQCTGERLLRAQDDLVKLREDIQNHEEIYQKGKDTGKQNSARFLKAYLLLWSSTIFVVGTATLSFLLMMILGSGHIMREMFPTSFINYENLRQAKQRDLVEKSYQHYRRLWEEAYRDFNNSLINAGLQPQQAVLPSFADSAELDDQQWEVKTSEKDVLLNPRALLAMLKELKGKFQ